MNMRNKNTGLGFDLLTRKDARRSHFDSNLDYFVPLPPTVQR